jgi:hypothetical protein
VPTTLPYEFDTSSVWRTILQGGIVIALILGVSILVSLLIGHFVAALQLTLIVGLLLFAERMALKVSSGSIGTITHKSIVVH